MMYEKDNEEITSAFIGNLLGLVSEHLNYAEPGMKEVRAAKVPIQVSRSCDLLFGAFRIN